MTIDTPRSSAATRPWARRPLGYYLAVAVMLVVALIGQLINPQSQFFATRTHGGLLPVAGADPWPGPPGPGGGDGGAPPGGGTQFIPPQMPAQAPDYSGNNSLPPLDQSNSVNIYNQAPNQAPRQAPAQQAPIEQGGPPAHGQQPPAYDNAPGQIQQQPQPNPDQQQQPVQQQQQEQQPQQQEQPEQQQQEQQQQRDQCKQQSSIPAPGKRTAAEDEIYKDLRDASPNKALNERVARDWGLVDENGNIAGYPAEWVVDHVIPIDRIVKIPGFAKLPREIQLMIIELPENTFPMGPNLNKSKGNKVPKEWPGYVKRTGEAMSPEQYAKLCDQQDIAIERIMEEISNQDIASKTSPSPNTGSKPETGNIPGRQHLPQPTAPGTAPPQAPTAPPTQMPTEHPSAPSTPPGLPAPQVPRTSGPPAPPPPPPPGREPAPATAPMPDAAPVPAPFPYEPPLIPSTPYGDPIPAFLGLLSGVAIIGGLVISGALGGATG